MVTKNLNEPAQNIDWPKIQERTQSKDANGSVDWTTAAEVVGNECPACGHIPQEIHTTSREQEGIPNYIALMQEAMEERYSKPREGYHVSDVTLCPRLKVFQRIDRRPIGAKTVSIYSAGKAIHEAVQWLFLSDKRTFEREKYVEFEDIQGSVDIFDRRRNIPVEFKTTRASDIKEPKSFHVEQLKYYIAMLGASQGIVLYQLLMHFGNTPFKAFRITMNAQERRNQREKLVTEIDSLKRAMEKRDPSIARSVGKDPSLNWLCKDCPYLTDCKKIQQAVVGAA